eukprot:scaffold11586_cov36-Phaeocystis_antarctica.AAC.1
MRTPRSTAPWRANFFPSGPMPLMGSLMWGRSRPSPTLSGSFASVSSSKITQSNGRLYPRTSGRARTPSGWCTGLATRTCAASLERALTWCRALQMAKYTAGART